MVGEIDTGDFPPLPSTDNPSMRDRIRAYHGGLNSGPRTNIERGLKTGAIRGVWSTSALGLGVDIGSLDVVILDGYPGSIMETFQWAGRAGRGDNECLVVLVGSNDPLDQRVIEDPDRLLTEDPEKAIVNPQNEAILDDHLICAADERPLDPRDEQWFGDVFPSAVTRLEHEERLVRDIDGRVVWRAPNDDIQYEMDLRNTGQQIVLKTTTGEKIGDLDFQAALRDAHPNAIYRADGTTYQVERVDYDRGVARLGEYYQQQTQEYTQLLYEKSVEIVDDISTLEKETLEFDGINIPAAVGTMTISKDIRGYNYYESHDSEPEMRPFEEPVPEPEMTTTGFVLKMPARWKLTLPEHIEKSDGDEDDDEGFTSGYLAALHAIEHAVIGLLPTTVLCDRQDIGGLSTEVHTATDGPAIFVHDAHEGGAGLTRAAFEDLETLVQRTYEQITECSCATGCNRCVLSEYCGSANRDICKAGASAVLEQMLEDVDSDPV